VHEGTYAQAAGLDFVLSVLNLSGLPPLTRHDRKVGCIKEIRIIDAERREFRLIFLSLFQVTKRNTS
jgi:hypothetical protein